MSLDKLVKVITKNDGVADVIYHNPYSTPNNERCRSLFGVVFERYELADGVNGRADEVTLRKFEGVFEGIESGKLYLVRQQSWHGSMNQHRLSITEDTRQNMFGSREMYIAFFKALNEAHQNSIVDDGQYMGVIDTVNKNHRKMMARIVNHPIVLLLFWQGLTLRYFQKQLASNPTIKEYIKRAEATVGKG